jgi:hypothetical protein
MSSVAYCELFDIYSKANALLSYGKTGPIFNLGCFTYRAMHVPTPRSYKLSIFGFYCILIGNLFIYYFYWVGVNNTFTIWKPPDAILPDDGTN